MTEQTILQPPLPQGPPAIPSYVAQEPAEVKVFGILHLSFAGLGLLGAAWGLINLFFNPYTLFMPPSPELVAQMDLQMALQKKMAPATITSTILSILLAIPMIIAGIKLVKKRADGLKWSNIYASASLITKVVNIGLAVLIIVPAMNEMTHGTFSKIPSSPKMGGIMEGAILIGMIGGVLITCIYPIATLIVLNRKSVKAWFASLPR